MIKVLWYRKKEAAIVWVKLRLGWESFAANQKHAILKFIKRRWLFWLV